MLMKIGEVTKNFNISHRSLHYWESVGILQSLRGENDYRFYDEVNVQKIKQIMFLRKLRMSIPSIQEIFTSNELSEMVAVFSEHLGETQKESAQLHALGIILNQLLNMLKDRQSMDCVYKYLDTAQNTESEELKAALKAVLSEPVNDIALEAPPKPIIEMTNVDLSLEEMVSQDIREMTEVIKRCYAGIDDIESLLDYYDFKKDLQMPGCRWWYKLMLQGDCVGAVNLAHTGMNSMLIRNIAYMEPDNNTYIFELLKRKHPNVVSWLIFDAGEEVNEYCYPDRVMKKTRFREDNGFRFLTSANRRNQYEYLMKPFDQIYSGSKYRYALGLDETSDLSNLSWLRCAMGNADWYDNYMGGWRITDCFFGDAVIYDTGVQRSKFYKNNMANCNFLFNNMENSFFMNNSLINCKLEGCDITGMTIDGISVEDALKFYRENKAENE